VEQEKLEKVVNSVGEDSGYEILKRGRKARAKITSVETKRAGDVFKNATVPDQQLIVISANVYGWVGRIATIPKPPSRYVSPRFKMAQFITKYRKPPEVGMTVDVTTNEKGYWTLVL
jgi:hypothetical protein